MKLSIFIGVLFGMIAANFIYQFCCHHPDWGAAAERSWFQAIALAALGASHLIASINPN